MKKTVKNILTSIVVIALLFSSFGFDIYKHICTTHNLNAASILEIPECEKEHSDSYVVDDCCKTEVEEITKSQCCDSEPVEDANSTSLSAIDVKCCFTSFEKISLNENLFPPVEKKNTFIDFISVTVPIDQIENQKSEQVFFINNNLPPPIFGKIFLQSIHQLKLDTPIC
ncbi:MAG TPA: hypothetical protein PL018_06335 [Ignavibacteriaceae bacterium]|nr:hypothetical protein [Ignavibacterium sp.]HMN25140.1 hypothetical protein [Ignavibacteriaceae bacterium]HRN26269.1 hypothetical protein [Ignavibacteriaceae bacterium]HRQ53853.1 hypothetical protein [Ignavibacteriaceae bacterium]